MCVKTVRIPRGADGKGLLLELQVLCGQGRQRTGDPGRGQFERVRVFRGDRGPADLGGKGLPHAPGVCLPELPGAFLLMPPGDARPLPLFLLDSFGAAGKNTEIRSRLFFFCHGKAGMLADAHIRIQVCTL